VHVQSQESADAAAAQVIAETGRIDVLIHNAGHMAFGPAEAFTRGTNHFTNAGAPDDTARVAEYETGPYRGFAEQVQQAFAAIVPDDADPASVSDAIAKVVDMPFGQQPFRVHVDPTQDGADVGFTVLDRMRTDMLYRVGLGDLTKPRVLK
jgi:hypothetical protein